MSVLSPLFAKTALGLVAATTVGGAAAQAPSDLPRPSNGHSDNERVSPDTQLRVAAAACSRDAAQVKIETRLAMSLDDFEEVLRKVERRGVDAPTLKARYRAVFKDEVLKASLNAEARSRTASEIEGDPAETVARALAGAERAFTARTGVTAVAVLEGLELSVDAPECGGPVFEA